MCVTHRLIFQHRRLWGRVASLSPGTRERGLTSQDFQTAAPTTRPHFLPVATAMQREYKVYAATAVVRKKREERTALLLKGTK